MKIDTDALIATLDANDDIFNIERRELIALLCSHLQELDPEFDAANYLRGYGFEVNELEEVVRDDDFYNE